MVAIETMLMWMLLTLLQAGQEPHAPALRLVHNEIVEDGVEIVHYDAPTRSLMAVGGDAQYRFALREDGAIELTWREVFSRSGEWTPTSIAVDPKGRGFAASSWVPTPVDAAQGMVQFVDLRDQRVVWQLPVGEHPDCIAFTPDGDWLMIANECEPASRDLPGALTLIDLSRVESVSDLTGLNETITYGFGPEHLHESVTLGALRISAHLRDQPERDIEPEYLAPTSGGAWVSLQENNALAYFDLAQRKWTRIMPLGALSFPFDPDDGGEIDLLARDGLALLHEPDTIDYARINGRGVIILANEGEQDDSDTIRLKDAMANGIIDPGALARLSARYGDVRSALGRLWISTIDGDLDGDGDIDIPTTVGGRSVSLIDEATGVELWNSGPQIELVTAETWPELYNADDSRSDRGGPEPEGLAVGEIDGRTIAFVGLERADIVMMYDISDPLGPRLLATQRLPELCSSPEGLEFFSDGPRHYLAVAAEKGKGCLSIYRVMLGSH